MVQVTFRGKRTIVAKLHRFATKFEDYARSHNEVGAAQYSLYRVLTAPISPSSEARTLL